MMISATVLQGEPSAAVLAFRRLLEQAEDADGLTALLCTEAQRTLLRRAAIPRMFDRRLVERAMMRDLRQDPAGGATYEWLIAHDDVEAIAAFPGCYRMKEGPRAAANEQ